MKERPIVTYVDLPVFGAPMRLSWKKHRMRCVHEDCAAKSWVLTDHRIAAKNCLLTTRAAKWATVQVGTGRTVLEVAKELSCDWHTVNDAVTTYGEALLEADRKRLNRTAPRPRRDELRQLGGHHTAYATTVTDVGQPPDHRHPAHPELPGRGRFQAPAHGLEGAHRLRGP